MKELAETSHVTRYHGNKKKLYYAVGEGTGAEIIRGFYF